jgi:hypothetical protein
MQYLMDQKSPWFFSTTTNHQKAFDLKLSFIIEEDFADMQQRSSGIDFNKGPAWFLYLHCVFEIE